jgi:hypothetical protein
MMMVAMGLVFPPVGLIAFVVAATADVDLMKVYKGTSVLMMAIVITTILLIVFRDIALWCRGRCARYAVGVPSFSYHGGTGIGLLCHAIERKRG